MQSHTIEVNGALTHYLEECDPGAPNFVLIHDGGFGADCWATWRPIMARLEKRYHLYSPDQLGFGGTQKLYDFGQGARSQKIDHLRRWMDAVGIRDTHVMGNSAGGSLVLYAAMRGEWPIRKAISIGGSGGPYMTFEPYGPLRDYVPDKEGMRRIVELMVSRRDAVMEELVEERYRKSLIRGHWENLSAVRLRPPGPRPKPESDEPYFQSLARIKVPVLLVAGADDVLLDRGWEQKVARHIPGAQTLVMEGARHQPHLDAPDAFCNAIEAFLGA